MNKNKIMLIFLIFLATTSTENVFGMKNPEQNQRGLWSRITSNLTSSLKKITKRYAEEVTDPTETKRQKVTEDTQQTKQSQTTVADGNMEKDISEAPQNLEDLFPTPNPAESTRIPDLNAISQEQEGLIPENTVIITPEQNNGDDESTVIILGNTIIIPEHLNGDLKEVTCLLLQVLKTLSEQIQASNTNTQQNFNQLRQEIQHTGDTFQQQAQGNKTELTNLINTTSQQVEQLNLNLVRTVTKEDFQKLQEQLQAQQDLSKNASVELLLLVATATGIPLYLFKGLIIGSLGAIASVYTIKKGYPLYQEFKTDPLKVAIKIASNSCQQFYQAINPRRLFSPRRFYRLIIRTNGQQENPQNTTPSE